MAKVKHFLDIDLLDSETLKGIIETARKHKDTRKGWPKGRVDNASPLTDHILATVFEKPSTRTRFSFDVAMRQLGGQTIVANSGEMQLGRGETIADTAKVLSRFVDGIVLRTSGHEILAELAANSDIPVINGLTDLTHPCQIMADIMTFEEHRGSIGGKVIAWTGDGNNVCHSWLQAAARFDFEMRVATPEGAEPNEAIVNWAKSQGATIHLTRDANEAVKGAHCVVADTFVSMGEEDAGKALARFMPYQVNDDLMAKADPSALFMHCLPAHRNEEVTDSVMDGPQSVVWDEAENRLHAQKAILLWCLTD